MLGRGDGAVVARIVALHSGDKGHAHARGQERVFAVGLLAASPAGIAEDIEIGRPEIEALEDFAGAVFHVLRVLDAAFGADGHGHLMNGRRVEGGAQSDGFGKLGGAVAQHAVERLAPPVIGRHVEPRDGARLIHKLGGFLWERHAMDQVGGSLLRGQAGVKVRRFGVLRSGQTRRRAAHQHCRYPSEFMGIHRKPLSVNSNQFSVVSIGASVWPCSPPGRNPVRTFHAGRGIQADIV